MKERIKHLILVILLVVLDQGSKFWVRTELINQDKIDIIPKVLNLQYSINTGAVWGILSGKVDFLKIVSLIILVVITFAYFKIPNVKKYNVLKTLVVFIIAGAMGNLIDRFYLGYVVDFIYFEIINFPLFNLADTYLTVASILLFILAMFYYKDEDFEFLNYIFKKKKASTGEINSSEDIILDASDEYEKEAEDKEINSNASEDES